jgi:hypothetical protein
MSPDSREFQESNLVFFKKMILEPALEYWPRNIIREGESAPDEHARGLVAAAAPNMHAIGLIEASLWLRLGIELDYFHKEMVTETLASIEPELSAAWTCLKTERIYDDWCYFMSDEPGPKFMKDRFLDPMPVLQQLKNFLSNREYFEQLSQCFLGCLLLTSEVIFDPKTMWFLELIGWASDESFEILLRAHPAFSSFSIEETYLGFAKHITYFHQLVEHLNNNTFPMAENSDRLSFYSIVIGIVEARRLLNRERARTRCFRLGGDIAALLYQPFPEWQEVRKSIFMDIARACGGPFDIAQYWTVFERTTEARRRAIREATPESSSFE